MKIGHSKQIASLSLGLIAFLCAAYIAAVHAENRSGRTTAQEADSDQRIFDLEPTPELQPAPSHTKTFV